MLERFSAGGSRLVLLWWGFAMSAVLLRATELELATWDFAALQVIVDEAGGRMSQFDGSALVHGGTVVTTNGLLHDEIVARLRPED